MADSATCHDLVDSQEYGGQTAATLRRIFKQSRRTNCSIELLTFGSLARTVGSKSTCGHAHAPESREAPREAVGVRPGI